jgi:hypothetical protein
MWKVLSGCVLACAMGGAAHATQFDLQYEAAIHSVVVLGKANLRGQINAASFSIAGAVETSAFGAVFDDTRLTVAANGAPNAAVLRTASYSMVHNYARKSRRVVLRRVGADVKSTVVPAHGDLGAPPATSAQINASNDPLTSLVGLGLQVGASGTCAARALVFDGKQHYALTLSGGQAATLRARGYSGPVVACTMRYEPISGFKRMSAGERAKIPTGQIYFARSAGTTFAAPVRIAVSTPLGEARLDIVKLTVKP